MAGITIKLSTGYLVDLHATSLFEDLDHLVGAVFGEISTKFKHLSGPKVFPIIHEEFQCVADQFPNEPKALKSLLVALFDYCIRNEIKWRMTLKNQKVRKGRRTRK